MSMNICGQHCWNHCWSVRVCFPSEWSQWSQQPVTGRLLKPNTSEYTTIIIRLHTVGLQQFQPLHSDLLWCSVRIGKLWCKHWSFRPGICFEFESTLQCYVPTCFLLQAGLYFWHSQTGNLFWHSKTLQQKSYLLCNKITQRCNAQTLKSGSSSFLCGWFTCSCTTPKYISKYNTPIVGVQEEARRWPINIARGGEGRSYKKSTR